MSKTKAIIDFSRYSPADLGALAQVIHDAMEANATTFPAPPIALTALQTQITDYQTKLLARASGAIADVNALDDARAALEETLAGFGNYVNTVAKGNETLVDLSGIPSYNTDRTPDTNPPPAPQDLRLSHGDLSGTIAIRYKPDRPTRVNEIQVTLGDPSNEAGWVQKAFFTGGRGELTGFAPGVIVYVRVRSIGIKGVMGVWSDLAQIRTL